MIPYERLRKDSRVDLAAAVPLYAPLTVYVEPTNRCNLSCNFCPQSLDEYEDKTGKRQDMHIDMFRTVMSEIGEMGIKSLKLYFFGEPFLHPEISAMMKLAVGACSRVEVTTNGMALSERNCRAILTSGIHYLRVSVYPDVRPALVARNVERLMKMREECGLIRPVIAIKVFNEHERRMTAPLFADISDEIVVEGLHTIGSEFVQISQQPRGPHVACPYPFYNLVVKSNGDVVPCCVAWEDSLVVGNVGKETLADIWAGEALARIHRLHLEGRRSELKACAQCDTLYNSPDSVDGLSPEEYDRRRA